MRDLGTFSIDELIAKLIDMRNRAITEHADPNMYAVYTVGPLGQYRKIVAIVMEEDGVYLNTSILR